MKTPIVTHCSLDSNVCVIILTGWISNKNVAYRAYSIFAFTFLTSTIGSYNCSNKLRIKPSIALEIGVGRLSVRLSVQLIV